MKRLHFYKIVAGIIFILILQNCGTVMNLPVMGESSTLGEMTPYTKKLQELPKPHQKIVIGVYKFKDQTGQYKMQDNGGSWSTAIPQGTTSILLKALEDSKWFRPIERENISDVLNERQIIRSTRKEYQVADDGKTKLDDKLPPLLYAGILLEGGIISYDSNVMTGGIGARYFGLGGSTQYRQDRVTVYLRVVSSMTGEILKTVYTSKNILYTSVNGSFFRYIDLDRLLEIDMGITQNEPVSLAVTQAIEKAVYTLVVEGVRDNLWFNDRSTDKIFSELLKKYDSEEEKSSHRTVGNKFSYEDRTKLSVFGMLNADQIKGDYTGAQLNIGGRAGIKYFFLDNLNLELSTGFGTFENEGIFKENHFYTDLNLEYLVLPKYKFSPYIYGGLGNMYAQENYFKAQVGGGFEYLMNSNLAIRINSQYDLGFNDKWDDFVNGTRKDQAIHFGLGLNYYIPISNKKTSKP